MIIGTYFFWNIPIVLSAISILHFLPSMHVAIISLWPFHALPQPDLDTSYFHTLGIYDDTIFQWDGDSFQRGAANECPFYNCLQLVTKFHFHQGVTTIECISLDNLDRRQVDAPQRIAAKECPPSNSFQLVTFNIRQGVTTIECPSLNNCDASHFN